MPLEEFPKILVLGTSIFGLCLIGSYEVVYSPSLLVSYIYLPTRVVYFEQAAIFLMSMKHDEQASILLSLLPVGHSYVYQLSACRQHQ